MTKLIADNKAFCRRTRPANGLGQNLLRTILNVTIGISAFGCATQEPLLAEGCGSSTSCGGEIVYAVDELQLASANEAGLVAGFNVDGLDSVKDEPTGCDTDDYEGTDGTAGVDNQVTRLLDSVGPGITDLIADALQATVNSGGLILLFELVGINPQASAGSGGLVIRLADNVPLIGTNDRLISAQTFDLPPDPLIGQSDTLQIENHEATAGPVPLDFRFVFLATAVRMPIAQAWTRFSKVGDAEISGVIGGVIAVSDLLGAISFIGGDDEQLRLTLEAVVPQLADVEGESGECDHLSFGLTFHAVPAYIFDGPVGAQVDPGSPEFLFAKATCGGCHTVSGVKGAAGFLGPSLDGLGLRAGETVEGLSAQAYVRESIEQPSAHVVPGFEGTMPEDLARFLTETELETVIAWLLTL